MDVIVSLTKSTKYENLRNQMDRLPYWRIEPCH